MPRPCKATKNDEVHTGMHVQHRMGTVHYKDTQRTDTHKKSKYSPFLHPLGRDPENCSSGTHSDDSPYRYSVDMDPICVDGHISARVRECMWSATEVAIIKLNTKCTNEHHDDYMTNWTS